MSLDKAAKGFNTEHKGIFPYLFTNTAPLDYAGDVPHFNNFTKITLEQYQEYKNEFIDKQ